LCDRYCRFSGVKWTKAAANAQLKSVTRWIFLDPSLSFDPTTLEPCSSVGAEASASPHKKMVSTTVLFFEHDRNGPPTQAVDAQFFAARVQARANCQDNAN
jgi:hypothetical protein